MKHNNLLPVGAVRIRTRHKRGGERRAWIKVGQPNAWKLRAQVVWERGNGFIPHGMVIHHKDGNKLNDSIDNLELMSKAKHLATHRLDFKDRAIAGLIAARRRLRWSTKSATKKTGRPCTWSDAEMLAAVAAHKAGEGSLAAIAKRFGVTKSALYHRLKRA